MKSKFASALSLALIMAMLLTSIGFADTITTDGDTLSTSPNVAISSCVADQQFNSSALIQYKGNLNVPHFASSGGTLTIAYIVDAPVYVSGSTTQTLPSGWDSTSDVYSFSFSTKAPAGISNGTYKVAVEVTGPKQGGGTLTLSDFFNVNVNCPTAPSDTTPPDTTIIANPTNPTNLNSASFGFTGSDNLTPAASLTFECSLDGAVFTACTSPQSYSGVLDGSHTFQVRAIDAANLVDPTPASFTWLVDTVAPTVTATPNRPADHNGWYNQPVTVSFSTDDGSPCEVAKTYSEPDSASASVSGTCQDSAGNVGSGTFNFQYDATEPAILGSRNPDPNGYGWNKVDVEVTFACADNLSGVASCGPTPQTVSAEGSGQSITGTVVDNAGNSNGTTVSNINIDKTAPVITDGGPTTSPDGSNGWYISTVTNQFSADGAISGLADATKASFTVSSGVAEGSDVKVNSGPVSDKADNTNPGTESASFKIDLSNPSLVCQAEPTFILNQAGAQVTATVSDIVSGPASATLSAVADTSSVGSKSVNVTGYDNAGRSATVSCSYSVIYNWNGFFQPVDNLPALNKAKAGSAIPVKFSLGGNQGLNIIAANYPSSNNVTCGNTATADLIESTVTAGSSSLSYDALADQYVYVWKTDKTWAGTCRTLTVKLADGTIHQANFTFTK